MLKLRDSLLGKCALMKKIYTILFHNYSFSLSLSLISSWLSISTACNTDVFILSSKRLRDSYMPLLPHLQKVKICLGWWKEAMGRILLSNRLHLRNIHGRPTNSWEFTSPKPLSCTKRDTESMEWSFLTLKFCR
jgi:hypothetical protein